MGRWVVRVAGGVCDVFREKRLARGCVAGLIYAPCLHMFSCVVSHARAHISVASVGSEICLHRIDILAAPQRARVFVLICALIFFLGHRSRIISSTPTGTRLLACLHDLLWVPCDGEHSLGLAMVGLATAKRGLGTSHCHHDDTSNLPAVR